MIRHSEETKLARSAIGALESLGYECIRINSGNRPAPGGGYIRGAKKGTPDWVVVHPYIWLEFKDLSELSPVQRRWHAWAKRCAIPVIVARSVSDAIAGVSKERARTSHFERLVIEDPKKLGRRKGVAA
jgi:hypothetical protein